MLDLLPTFHSVTVNQNIVTMKNNILLGFAKNDALCKKIVVWFFNEVKQKMHSTRHFTIIFTINNICTIIKIE